MLTAKTNIAYLVLEDGTVFKGFSMGKIGETIGEVVFNTCTASYQELLSDPTYYGQIVAQTYPLVGNRGIEKEGKISNITANGYIAREWCDTPSNIHGGLTLDEYLKSRDIVGIWGIDTRRLTRTLRDKGYFKGAITKSLENFDNLLINIKSYSVHRAIEFVTIKETIQYKAEYPKYDVVILDYGFSRAMLPSFLKRGCNLTVVPARTEPDEILSLNPDGIIYPDGPGDPDDDLKLINNIKILNEYKIPSLGIGVGHQMMAIASGGEIKKMPKGHRGSNQPVKICGTKKVMITNQNHGYDVDDGSLPETDAKVWMTNVNDNSVEGLLYNRFPFISVQFIPCDIGNYSDSSWIYDEFIKLMEGGRGV